mmetsp:Transcript_23403/g.43056  ORF Transcript_23403/g.43056 Transcript_23403/m.43056 type:complete len:179 (-) Transcript_23403:133-669(-)
MGATHSCCCEEDLTQGSMAMPEVQRLPVVTMLGASDYQKTDKVRPGTAGNGMEVQFAANFNDGSPVTTAPESTPEGLEERGNSRKTFLVDVLIPEGGKLGFGIVYREGENRLEVVKLHDNGMIKEWNREHPDKMVQVGSHILAINDEMITPASQEEMARAVAQAFKNTHVRLLVEPKA